MRIRPRYNARSNQLPSRFVLPALVIPSHHDNGRDPRMNIQNTGIQNAPENFGRAPASRLQSHQMKGRQRKMAKKRFIRGYAVTLTNGTRCGCDTVVCLCRCKPDHILTITP